MRLVGTHKDAPGATVELSLEDLRTLRSVYSNGRVHPSDGMVYWRDDTSDWGMSQDDYDADVDFLTDAIEAVETLPPGTVFGPDGLPLYPAADPIV